jgi:hypothetical protein
MRGLPAVFIVLLLCVTAVAAYVLAYNVVFLALYHRHLLRTGVTADWLNISLTFVIPFAVQMAIVATSIARDWVGDFKRATWIVGFVVAAAGSYVCTWLIACEPFSCI